MEIENEKYYNIGKKAFLLSIIQKGGLIFMFYAFLLILLKMAAPVFTPVLGPITSSVFSLINMAAIIFFVLMEAFVVISATLEYSVSKIMLDESSLKISRGILNKEEISLPYRRIQSVKIKQTLLHRILGVGRLLISITTDIDQPGETNSDSNDQTMPLMNYNLASAISEAISHRTETEKMQVQQKA